MGGWSCQSGRSHSERVAFLILDQYINALSMHFVWVISQIEKNIKKFINSFYIAQGKYLYFLDFKLKFVTYIWHWLRG